MMGLPDAAEKFQSAGITVLTFDPRSTGLSDGQPRNEIDPFKQVEDLSDALTFLSSISGVDPSQMGVWGMSFGAAVILCAAALDKRVKFAIAVCPLTEFEYDPEKRPKVLAKCIKDRESQVLGNPPFYLPMVTEKGESPVGFGKTGDKERYARFVEIGKELARNHVNRTTIQTYYKIFMWQPLSLWQHLAPTPFMFVVPKLDMVSPSENQIHHFGELKGPKRLHVEPGLGHEDILVQGNLASLMKVQIQFIDDALESRVI